MFVIFPENIFLYDKANQRGLINEFGIGLEIEPVYLGFN